MNVNVLIPLDEAQAILEVLTSGRIAEPTRTPALQLAQKMAGRIDAARAQALYFENATEYGQQIERAAK